MNRVVNKLLFGNHIYTVQLLLIRIPNKIIMFAIHIYFILSVTDSKTSFIHSVVHYKNNMPVSLNLSNLCNFSLKNRAVSLVLDC